MRHLRQASPIQISPVGFCPSRDPPTQGTTCSFARPTWHREGHSDKDHPGKARSGAAGTVSMGSGSVGSDAAYVGAAYSSDGTTSLSATTWLASNSIPAGGTATRQVYWEGSHFQLLRRQSCPCW